MIDNDLLSSGNFLQTWVRQGGPSNLCSRLDDIEEELGLLSTAIITILTESVTEVESSVSSCTQCVRSDCEDRVIYLEHQLDETYTTLLTDFHVAMSNIESTVVDMSTFFQAYLSQQQQQQQGQGQTQTQSLEFNPNVNIQNVVSSISEANATTNPGDVTIFNQNQVDSNGTGGEPNQPPNQFTYQLFWVVAIGGNNVPITLSVAGPTSGGDVPSGAIAGPYFSSAIAQQTLNFYNQLSISNSQSVDTDVALSVIGPSLVSQNDCQQSVNITTQGQGGGQGGGTGQPDTATATAIDDYTPELEYDLSDDAFDKVIASHIKYSVPFLASSELARKWKEAYDIANEESGE